VRNLALDLRPAMLDHLGLGAALRWYLDRQAQRAGFAAELVVEGLERRLPPEVEIACYRLVQEAVTNVARHARARRVRVELRQSKSELRVLIRDDGCGFDVRHTRAGGPAGEHLGLISMEERVSFLGGEFRIESSPNRGSEIRARLPLRTP